MPDLRTSEAGPIRHPWILPALWILRGAFMTSVNHKTYLFLEEIYLKAADESQEETDAFGLMGIVWNLLTVEEQASLSRRRYKYQNQNNDAPRIVGREAQ